MFAKVHNILTIKIV